LVDVIYNGFVGKRNNGIMFFENRGDKYVTFMSFLGDIVEIWASDAWVPLSFKVWNYRCCGNYVDFIETYVPQLTYQLNVKYVLSNKIATVDGMVLPKKFEMMQPFKTREFTEVYAFPTTDTNSYEFLHTEAPHVDTVPHSEYFHHTGSITAWLDTAANGFILNEQIVRDSTWYFIMTGYENRVRGVFCGKGDNNGSGYYITGWIKADDHIELIPMKKPHLPLETTPTLKEDEVRDELIPAGD
jgi:hypothetical protein